MSVALKILPGCTTYDGIEKAMESKALEIANTGAVGEVWFVEHEHTYTVGSGEALQGGYHHNTIVLPDGQTVPLYQVARGGKHTYHGPGQRVIYVMLNLKNLYGSHPDIKVFVQDLNAWIILTLATLGVEATIKPEHIGVWVQEEKIAAMGIKLKKWVSYHGIALNVRPSLEMFRHIIPCGIRDKGICSLRSLGYNAITIREVDDVLVHSFSHVFNHKLMLYY
jgi:lipoyl(octanoyl) transferase